MRLRWSALVLVLTLGLMPRAGFAQNTQKAPAGKLQQNYPNPFNPETRGVFTVADASVCSSGSGVQHKVSVRIYNILSQLVAVPVLQGGTANVAGGQPLVNVLLPCGQYTWYWNGFYQNTGKEAASGVYVVIIEVDGRKVDSMKMTNAK